MLRSVLSLMAVVFMSALLTVSSGCATWHKSQCAELSPDASAAIQRAYPAAKVGKAKAETEDGVKVYEVELTSNGVETDADVTESGTILKTETSVSVKDLPQAVADAVAKAAPGAEIKKAKKQETLADAKTGALATPSVAYVVEVAKEGKEGELEVAGDGKISKELEWEEKEHGKSNKDEREEGKHAE